MPSASGSNVLVLHNLPRSALLADGTLQVMFFPRVFDQHVDGDLSTGMQPQLSEPKVTMASVLAASLSCSGSQEFGAGVFQAPARPDHACSLARQLWFLGG